jgi:hypothetical protein
VFAHRHEELLLVSGGGGESLLVLAGMWDCEQRCSRSCTATPAPRHSRTCHVCCKRASGTQTKASCVPRPLQPLGAANSSTRMCLSLDGPALLLILLRNLLLMCRASSHRALLAIDTSFNFLGLAMHLHLQHSIDGLALGVHPSSHGLGDLHPCGWFGLQATKKLAAFFAQQST